MSVTSSDAQSMHDQIAARLSGDRVDVTAAPPFDDAFSASLLFAVRDAVQLRPDLLPGSAAPSKAMRATPVLDPTEIDKGWFDDVMRTIATLAPAVVSTLQKRKDYTPQTIDELVSTAAPERAKDKEWMDTTVDLIAALVPAALQALRGTKDFTEPGSLPELKNIPTGKDKAWWNDVLNVVVQAAPIALMLL